MSEKSGGCFKWIGIATVVIAALVVVLIVVAVGGSNDPGSGSNDNRAVDDVTITTCAPSANPLLGQVATGAVVNHSSKASTYFVEIVFESADGATQLDSTLATLNEVQPGQTAPFEASSLKPESKVPGAVCRVADVTRTAS